MKFLRAQGHFGMLDGREITFHDGMNIFYLPNEGGKSTLCSFLRVMLYGLSGRRDGKNQLSDKTKYRPLDGSPMSGVLELEWRGKRIVISRQTGKGAPMQQFSAYHAETGGMCASLTAKDCGRTLTGVGEEGFRSTAFVDGQEQAVSAKELGDRMLSMSATGDRSMMYENAIHQLDQWKSALYGGSRGRFAQVEADIAQAEQALDRLDALQKENDVCDRQLTESEQQLLQIEIEEQQLRQDVEQLREQEQERARKQRLAEDAHRAAEEYQLARQELEDAIGQDTAEEKRGRLLPVIGLALAAVIVWIMRVPIAAVILLSLAAVILVVSYAGRFLETNVQANRAEALYGESVDRARRRFFDQMARLAPELSTADEEQLWEYLEHFEVEQPDGYKSDMEARLSEAQVRMGQLRQTTQTLRETLAKNRGKAEEIGARATLLSQLDRWREERENILWQVDAIGMAKQSLLEANAELTGRISPHINALAQEYMRKLTGGRYTAMQLYTDLEAVCRRSGSAVQLDRLRLSTGTRDQLYLALRLAVCRVLLDDAEESVPLILDDPFVNYDEERTANAMQLLREIARERQVILLTCRRLDG